MHLPVRRQVSGLLVGNGQLSTAVDGHVEHTVDARCRLAELGMIMHANAHATERRAVVSAHLAAHHRRSLALDRICRDVGLKRGTSLVEEFGRLEDRCDDGPIDRGRRHMHDP